MVSFDALGDWAATSLGQGISAGAILAEAFVAMPFLVITTEAGLRAMDRRYEDAAATLGASRRRIENGSFSPNRMLPE